jgi:hypothetical protein
MPPTFAYAMALLAYLALACVVWALAIVLAVPRETRPIAVRLAAGMAGSFPGVVLFQLLSVLIVAPILLAAGLITRVTARGGWIDAAMVGLAVMALAIFALASLAGFYVGWRAGWEIAAGRSARVLLVFRAVSRWMSASRA